MSAFLTPLRFEDENGLPFTLIDPLVYESDVLFASKVVIPAGFQTDLASIPRALWNVLPPVGAYDRAAVVHDFLYRHGGVTRVQADGAFLEAMQVCGVGSFRRHLIWLGVRAGGWKPWNAYRAQDASSV